MANNLTFNPISVDTASATPLLTKQFWTTSIRWVSKAATGGDDLVVQDQDGNVIFESVAAGSNYVEDKTFGDDRPLRINGLLVPTIDSGTLYLYTRESPPHS